MFQQRAQGHLSGKGCAKCAGNIRKTSEEYVSQAIAVHGDRYDYSEVNYVHVLQKVRIDCKDHGPFYQVAAEHLIGKGCYACGGTKNRQLLNLFRLLN